MKTFYIKTCKLQIKNIEANKQTKIHLIGKKKEKSLCARQNSIRKKQMKEKSNKVEEN